MGALYDTLLSTRFGPAYIHTPNFQERLAACHARNRQLTAALIENVEGAQVVLETRNGIPGSTFGPLQPSKLTSAAAAPPFSTAT